MARIVVADDEADIRRLIAFTLRRRGHEVQEAAAGEAALSLIRRGGADLAVLDVAMPGLTGPQVAAALTDDQATRDVPLLFVSAHLGTANLDLADIQARHDTLAKPFAPQDLAARVAALLEGNGP